MPCFKSFALSVLFLSIASCCSFAFSQSIQPTEEDNSVVIIGSRFPNTSDAKPIAASVITASEIRNAGIDNVNEAIRKLAGVYGRRSNRGTQDFDLDLSGFGINSGNNLVVMVDGVRLSESEIATSLLSSIPIDSVARIEIIRGGSSVLYGDGATGGVIQIITKQIGPTALTGSINAELGEFNNRLGSVSLTRGWDQLNLSLTLSDQRTDNYRANNVVTQQNMSGALTWYFNEGRAGLRIEDAWQKFGFAGALSLAQFEQDPRQSRTPLDNGAINLRRYIGFVEHQMGAWQLAAELSTRQRDSDSNFISIGSLVDYTGRQTTFSPRVRYSSEFGAMKNELVIGLDWMNWNRQTDSSFSLAYATQKSTATYFRNEMNFERARVALGARHEVFDKKSYDPIPGSRDSYNVVQNVNAWELQGSYAVSPMINLFSKLGQSYRVANVDDNAFTALPNMPLLPQISHDVEFGAELGDVNSQLQLRWFQLQLKNEIYFDPTSNNNLGANTNLDPTRRRGISAELKYRLPKPFEQFRLAMQAQHVKAVFTSGINDGKELVLVPKNTIAAHINWSSGNDQKAYIGAQWIDRQRYGSDFNNTCSSLVPSHVTFDARYARKMGNWEWSMEGTNLFNKQYFTLAFGCRSGIYPDDGRQLKVGLRYEF